MKNQYHRKSEWYVTVTYPLEYHPTLQSIVEKAGKRKVAYQPFIRYEDTEINLDFWFKSERGAVNFYKRLKKHCRRKTITIELPTESLI